MGIQIFLSLITLAISLAISYIFSERKTLRPAFYVTCYTLIVPGLSLIFLAATDYSLIKCIELSMLHPYLFAFIAFTIAVSSSIGGEIDAQIALYRYKKAHGAMPKKEDIWAIVKYGDRDKLLEGAGVYDRNAKLVLYNTISNVSGALCTVSILFFLMHLPEYRTRIMSMNWVDVTNPVVALMLIPGLQQYSALQGKERPRAMAEESLNPDNFLFDRLHVIFDAFHIWFTGLMVCIFSMTFLSYMVNAYQQYEISVTAVFPLISLTLFVGWQVYHSKTSKIYSVNSAAIKAGFSAISVVIAIALFCFKPSIATIQVMAAYVCTGVIWYFMLRAIAKDEEKDKQTGWMLAVVTIAVFAIGFIFCIQLWAPQ